MNPDATILDPETVECWWCRVKEWFAEILRAAAPK
jgi:hypothetical protein